MLFKHVFDICYQQSQHVFIVQQKQQAWFQLKNSLTVDYDYYTGSGHYISNTYVRQTCFSFFKHVFNTCFKHAQLFHITKNTFFKQTCSMQKNQPDRGFRLLLFLSFKIACLLLWACFLFVLFFACWLSLCESRQSEDPDETRSWTVTPKKKWKYSFLFCEQIVQYIFHFLGPTNVKRQKQYTGSEYQSFLWRTHNKPRTNTGNAYQTLHNNLIKANQNLRRGSILYQENHENI